MKNENLIFIMSDHQRADSIGMHQCGREVTPHLNALAGKGIRFDRAYTVSPLCVPARTALATGIYPRGNEVLFNDWAGRCAAEHMTIHRFYRKAGYRTAHVGVNHIRVKPPLTRDDFDFYYDEQDYAAEAAKNGWNYPYGSYYQSPVDEISAEGGSRKRGYSNSNCGVWEGDPGTHQDSIFAQKALEFLEEEHSGPFALFLYFWAPHPPLVVPRPYDTMYDPEMLVLPGNVGKKGCSEPALREKGIARQLGRGKPLEHWRKTWAAHLGLVSYLDKYIGKILKLLSKSDIIWKTTIVFTADHGDSLGQRCMYQKMENYEPCIRIPLILYDSNIKSRVVTTPVSHLDILPTLLELHQIGGECGEGKNLIRILENEKVYQDRAVYAQYSGNPEVVAENTRKTIITGRYKLTMDLQENELYDLREDPLEMINLAGREEYQEIEHKLSAQCAAYHSGFK